MKEYILDLTALNPNDPVDERFADHHARVEMENILLDHRGKKIRIKITICRK